MTRIISRTSACGQSRASGWGLITASLLLLLLGFAAGSSSAAGNIPAARLLSVPLPGGAGFAFDTDRNKTRRSVSGIACPSSISESRICLIAFDEGAEARFIELREGAIQPLEDRIVLLPGGGELDAEGAALDGDVFYVTGSHSPKRSSCASNPSSRHVIRFARDPASGRTILDSTGKPAGYGDSGELWRLMASLPELAPHVGDGKCLGSKPPRGHRGANIEAIAAKAGRLFFGFRGPAIDGMAPVLAVDAVGLFDGGAPNPKVTRLVVDGKRGIRDMQAVTGGFLVLAGPDDDSDDTPPGDLADWVVSFWDGQADRDGVAKPKPLASLAISGLIRAECDREIKPEALAVLEEGSLSYRVVILSDGMCDGGALLFEIAR